MIRPIERTILQSFGDVLFDSGWQILNGCIRKPRVAELADIEPELANHRLEGGNSQLPICVSEVDLVFAAIADKEIGDRRMSDTNCFIDPLVSIEQRAKVIHPLFDKVGFHSCQLSDRLFVERAVRSRCKKHSNHPLKLDIAADEPCF